MNQLCSLTGRQSSSMHFNQTLKAPLTTAPVQTEGSFAVNNESSQPKKIKPFGLLYTCGCTTHESDPPRICPVCRKGVIDVHSTDKGGSLKQSGEFNLTQILSPQLIPVLYAHAPSSIGSNAPPVSHSSSRSQEQQDENSRILSVYFG